MRVAVLLAAGASRRMGTSKLGLALGDETVLERSAANLLEAGLERVLVVVSHEADAAASLEARDRLVLVTNSHRDEGLSSSLRCGLERLPPQTSSVAIALADKPLVMPATIRALLFAFEGSAARIAYPMYRGEQGHPVLLRPELVTEFLGVTGDAGGKSLLMRYRDEALAIDVDDPGVCFDIDTREDYARALRIIGAQ